MSNRKFVDLFETNNFVLKHFFLFLLIGLAKELVLTFLALKKCAKVQFNSIILSKDEHLPENHFFVFIESQNVEI